NQIPVRSRHSVWVGNLSFSTDEAKLKDWFERRGVEGISRVHMPKGLRRNESNRGFAYVDLPSEEVVKSAIQLSENPLDGRKLLIKSGSDYTGRPEIDPTNLAALTGMEGEDQGASSLAGLGKKGKTGLTKTAQKILRSQKHPPGPTLFVGNLSFQSTEEGIRELLENSARRRDEWSKGEKQGTIRGAGIRKVRMGTFEDTGKCKGFAFIDFHTPAHATRTLIDPRNSYLDGRKLILQFAGADAVRRGAPKGSAAASSQHSKPRSTDAPAPGSFDPNAPLPKKHKETQEERRARRAMVNGGSDPRQRQRGSADVRPPRREKPGAALANAKRESLGIVASQGNKISF
ncbi:hypothetical protein IE53DRAFT_306582, partial [Violaceomyces palustris]